MIDKLHKSIHGCAEKHQKIKKIHLEQYAAQQMLFDVMGEIKIPEVGSTGTVYGIPFVIEPFGSPEWWFDL